MEKPDRVWAEIDLDCIAHNICRIREKVGDVKVAAVIKADGYGHGAIEIAQTLCENGVYMLVVATMEEGISLRRNGLTAPILVLGYICDDKIEEAIEYGLAVAITNSEMAKRLSAAAVRFNRNLHAHMKIDTGMNRVGFSYDDGTSILEALKLPRIKYDGIFSHFSCGDDEDFTYTNLQYERFLKVQNVLKENNIDIKIKHICNSGGVLLHKDMYLDMVRPGIIIYGLFPSDHCRMLHGMDLKCAMTFKSRIIMIKHVRKGEPISYGNRYVADKDSVIATIAAGYADGYSRVLSGKAKVAIKGRFAPVVGSICMDMCMADITGMDDVNESDEVTLFGKEIPAEDLADVCGTINYEFICKIGARVPRVYIKGGRIVKKTNYMP
jgi:alanine racemase